VRLRTTLTPARTPLAVALAVVLGVGSALGTADAASAAPVAASAAPALSTTITALPASGAAPRTVDQDAAFYANIARGISQQAAGKVDTTTLDIEIAQLDDSAALPELTVDVFTQLLRGTIGDVSQQLTAYDAAQAAAAVRNTPDGARATAAAIAASVYGWGSGQFACLNSLWQKESSWNYQAHNPSGATGIPQALPGAKMASAGADWATNATTQIEWGLAYIQRSYGNPCAAWGHSQATNWY
jgi:hypothetical protein